MRERERERDREKEGAKVRDHEKERERKPNNQDNQENIPYLIFSINKRSLITPIILPCLLHLYFC